MVQQPQDDVFKMKAGALEWELEQTVKNFLRHIGLSYDNSPAATAQMTVSLQQLAMELLMFRGDYWPASSFECDQSVSRVAADSMSLAAA